MLLKGIEAEFQPVKSKKYNGRKGAFDHFFFGISQMATSFGMGNFELKLYQLARNAHGKTKNLHILTQHQWEMEVPLLVSDETQSELNGE